MNFILNSITYAVDGDSDVVFLSPNVIGLDRVGVNC